MVKTELEAMAKADEICNAIYSAIALKDVSDAQIHHELDSI